MDASHARRHVRLMGLGIPDPGPSRPDLFDDRPNPSRDDVRDRGRNATLDRIQVRLGPGALGRGGAGASRPA